MAAAMATMSIALNAKCAVSPKIAPAAAPSKAAKPALPRAMTAGALLAAAAAAEPAVAAQQIADVAEGDSRGLALLLPIVPAVGWVLFNILQPALNQLNRMRESKGGIVVAAAAGGLAALGMVSAPEASAAAEAAGGDNRGTLLLFVIAPAVLWVLYNILQPALNQLNRMKSD